MRIFIILVIISTCISLSSKNYEEKTVFSKDNELFCVEGTFDNIFVKDSVFIKIDNDTKEKYYCWDFVPDSINYVFIDSVKTIKVDSVVHVGSGDKSGVLLIIKGKGIILLKKEGKDYKKTYREWPLYGCTLTNIYEEDINADKKKEIIIVFGNESYYNFDIGEYSDEYSGFHSLYSRYRIRKPENTTDILKIRDYRAYFLYKNNNGLKKSFIKYGMIDYYKNDHSDLYFLPLSITNLEQWNKL